jgi:excisionase family DNA binding protein
LKKYDLLTVKEFAGAIGRSVDFARDEIEKKRIAHLRLGARIFITESDLEAYLARARTAALGERPHSKRKEAGA